MLLNLFNIVYVLIAIAMIAMILLQRGAGAQAGSGFGSGASGTVFGSRGATTFLSRSTAILAAVFFVLSLAMAYYFGHGSAAKPADDLGVSSGVETAAPKATITVPAAPAANSDVPSASSAGAPAPSAAQQSAAPASDVPKAAAPAPAQPAAATGDKKPASDKKADDAKKH